MRSELVQTECCWKLVKQRSVGEQRVNCGDWIFNWISNLSGAPQLLRVREKASAKPPTENLCKRIRLSIFAPGAMTMSPTDRWNCPDWWTGFGREKCCGTRGCFVRTNRNGPGLWRCRSSKSCSSRG